MLSLLLARTAVMLPATLNGKTFKAGWILICYQLLLSSVS